MKQQAKINRLLIFTFLLMEIMGGSFFQTRLALAGAAKMHELHVVLFGQPCLMRGPFEISALKAIHEISPEQIPPVPTPGSPDSISQLKKTLGKLQSTAKTPSSFDRYRERLIHRLEAQIAFEEGLRSAHKNQKAASFLNSIKPFRQQKSSLKNLETLAKKFEEKRPGSPQENLRLHEQLSEAYDEVIEPNPEEDFHTASRRLGIKYACSYEETGEDAEESPASEEEEKETPSLKEIPVSK